MKPTFLKPFHSICLILAVSAGIMAAAQSALAKDYQKSGHHGCQLKQPGHCSSGSSNDPYPSLEQLQALDRTDFMVLYPGLYTDYEKTAVAQYFADNAALNERGPVDVDALINGTLSETTPGIGPVIEVTEDWVRYQNEKYDPENPIRHDAAYAQAAGYDDILAYLSFGAHDDSVMIPWPPAVRDKLLVSDLNHSITTYHPIYPGDTLYLVANEREILDLTPPEGATYRSIAIQTKASVYNQHGEKVNDLIFRVTEGLSVYKDRTLAPAEPGFADFWDAPDWTTRPAHFYTKKDWRFMKKIWEKETIRGADPLYWEDVQVGDEPIWTLEGPIYAGATPTEPWGMGAGGSRNIKPEILDPISFKTLTRSETDGIYYLSNPDDQILPLPVDSDDAEDEEDEEDGAIDTGDIHDPGDRDRAALVNFMGRDFAIRHITNWMGDHGWIYHIGWSIMDPRAHAAYGKYVVSNPRAVRYLEKVPYMQDKYVNAHGLTKDIALVKSCITNKWVRDGHFEVELVWWIETIEGDIWQEGGAIVQLPSKNAE